MRFTSLGLVYPILGREQAYFPFTISLRRSTTFSENHATAKYEYPHVAGQRLRYTQQMRLQDGTPG
jgi:hypothetical protein